MSLHPKNFKGFVQGINNYLKENGHNDVQITSLTLEEPNEDDCTQYDFFPETRIDPVSHKKYIVFVKRCID